MRREKRIFLGVVLLVTWTGWSQELLKGSVYTAKDSTALMGVSVYFDGTSIGTTTTQQGKFRIEGGKIGVAPLVIGYLGYETLVLDVSSAAGGELPPVYLKEKHEELPEVIIEKDPWSRSRKLGVFRREFLGKTHDARKSRIKNEEVLKLRYFPSKNVLIAEATEPLVIINRNLGYEILYDLKSFRVSFHTGNAGLSLPQRVFYEGFVFFKELRKRLRKRHLRNRKLAYKGSTLHFMRSLASRLLAENDFRIFRERFEVPQYEFFEFEKVDGKTRVGVLAEKLSILYEELDQSSLQATEPFIIDALGNHHPPSSVIFSGEMGRKRLSQLLPLDYWPQKEL